MGGASSAEGLSNSECRIDKQTGLALDSCKLDAIFPFATANGFGNPKLCDSQECDCVDSPSRSGVFSVSTDKRLELFGESISFDHRLFSQDIAGSIAHAKMLARQGILTAEEADAIIGALGQIGEEIAAGKMPFGRSSKTSTCISSRR